MGKIKSIVSAVMAAAIIFMSISGCTVPDSSNTENSAAASVRPAQDAGNRDNINNLMQSWKIFNEAFSSDETDIMSDHFTEVIKSAILSESNDKNITLSLSCPDKLSDDYKRFADVFRQRYSDPRRCIINIKIVKTDDYSNYILRPKTSADVFICDDITLSKINSVGSAAKINENLCELSKEANRIDAFSSCIEYHSLQSSADMGNISPEDKVYGFPLSSGDGYYLIYDKQVYSGNSIGSIDDIIKTAADNSKEFLFPIDDIYCCMSVFLAAGCSLEKTDNGVKASFNSENGFNAAKALCSLVQKSGKGFSGSGDKRTIINGFKNGKICAAIADAETYGELKSAVGNYNIGIAALPSMNIGGKKAELHSLSGSETIGVNPYSSTPFTAQMLAYYLSSETVQRDIYNNHGCIPSIELPEYDMISGDPLYAAMIQQQQYTHQRSKCISYDFSSLMEEYNIGKAILEKNGAFTDNELIALLSEIPEIISEE